MRLFFKVTDLILKTDVIKKKSNLFYSIDST